MFKRLQSVASPVVKFDKQFLLDIASRVTYQKRRIEKLGSNIEPVFLDKSKMTEQEEKKLYNSEYVKNKRFFACQFSNFQNL